MLKHPNLEIKIKIDSTYSGILVRYIIVILWNKF